MGHLAQLGYVTQKVLKDKQRDIILIEIDLGKHAKNFCAWEWGCMHN